MGRETRILLGLLGLLAGLFVGVLSLKLLVPRPPAGAGPDVHGDVAFPVRQALVPPPAPATRAWDFTAAPPLVVTALPPANQAAAILSDPPAERFSDIAVDRYPEASRFPTPAAGDLAGSNDGTTRSIHQASPPAGAIALRPAASIRRRRAVSSAVGSPRRSPRRIAAMPGKAEAGSWISQGVPATSIIDQPGRSGMLAVGREIWTTWSHAARTTRISAPQPPAETPPATRPTD
jgi:hypothetical protein